MVVVIDILQTWSTQNDLAVIALLPPVLHKSVELMVLLSVESQTSHSDLSRVDMVVTFHVRCARGCAGQLAASISSADALNNFDRIIIPLTVFYTRLVQTGDLFWSQLDSSVTICYEIIQ
jgi:hypothetical protein